MDIPIENIVRLANGFREKADGIRAMFGDNYTVESVCIAFYACAEDLDIEVANARCDYGQKAKEKQR